MFRSNSPHDWLNGLRQTGRITRRENLPNKTESSDSVLVELSSEQSDEDEANQRGRCLSDGDQPEPTKAPESSTCDPSGTGPSSEQRQTRGVDGKQGLDFLGRPLRYKDGVQRLVRGLSIRSQTVTQLQHPVLHRARGAGYGVDG